MPLNFSSYDLENFYDELIQPSGAPRNGAKILIDRIESLPDGDVLTRHKAAEASMYNMG